MMCLFCIQAFDVAEQLGVARILNADDMMLLVVPDKLNVMTFVYQLRAQLTGCSMPRLHSTTSSQRHQTHTPSSVPPTSSDWLSNLCPLTDTERQAVDARYSQKHAAASARPNTEASSPAQPGRRLLPCTGQSSELVSSPTDHLHTAGPQAPADSAVLMTRQQLLNPFDSDSDCETKSTTASLTDDAGKHQPSLVKESRQRQNAEKASPCDVLQPSARENHASDQSSSTSQQSGQLAESDVADSGAVGQSTATSSHRQCSRREQLRERARMLLDQARRDAVTSPTSPVVSNSEDERHQRLRERARKLIAESRAARASSGSSVTQVITVHSRKPIDVPAGEMCGSVQLLKQHQDVDKLTTTNEHLHSPSATSYAEAEIEFLERSLARLDERAAGVEWSLRRIMDSQRNSNEDAQQRLVYEWFALVDERSELVRRIEQLNAVAQEQDLERRFELLSVELRRLMAECETSEKDEDSAERERLLLAELMSIVNQRDALVQQLDKQEQEIDMKSAPTVEARKPSRQDSACSMQ